ncbi:MAG: hypothetical protein NTZ95_01955 [Candidatus Omnitrophica bacterium]|nr:hypothetical protein [Candidatus Omnitrophota bacterium]
MKKKFEDNVASQMPKTKSEEPTLPWKIDESDLAKIDSESQDYKDLAQGAPPLKTRPVFLIALVLAIFAAALFMVASIAIENDRIKIGISEKEKEAAILQVNLDKAAAEKTTLEHNASQLEKRVNDLSAQKELFTAVLESLTKKEDVIPAETTSSQVPPSEILPSQVPPSEKQEKRE